MMRNQHRIKLQVIHIESTKEIMELRDQLEKDKKEQTKLQAEISKLKFSISEVKSNTLHKLCRSGNMEKLKVYIDRIDDVLLEKMLQNRKGMFGYTPLHEAAASGKSEVLKYLLNKIGRTDVNCCANHGHTPLHLAASGGHAMCVRELLAHGADISCVNQYGNTPKYAAIAS